MQIVLPHNTYRLGLFLVLCSTRHFTDPSFRYMFYASVYMKITIKSIRRGEQRALQEHLIINPHAGEWHRQNYLGNGSLPLSSVRWLKRSPIHCLCFPPHNRKAVCMLESPGWLFGLVLFVCLLGPT